ncbi:MAG: Gfo/Idh/MocA family oxidoreductase [Candidatus Hydrogenedentes bacterium]|nr:Gfo/Idh/MocA family oxidoreductase [Candidatus Hydrogenedentota bacterium]
MAKTSPPDPRTLRVTISGTGFAGGFTAQAFRQVPHRNGVNIELAGVTSGHLGNAQRFAAQHGVGAAFENHAEMLAVIRPDIECIACANYAHAQYVIEAAEAGVPVVVLEKPPLIWPGYAEGREADAETRSRESMRRLDEMIGAVETAGTRLLYAENFVYVDGVKALVEILAEAQRHDKGHVLYTHGICAHQGSHAPAYDTPAKSGGGALFNKACHPLGPALYLKQVEGILRDGKPIRPARVSAVALQILKHLPASAGEYFRVMQNVDDFSRITVLFDDETVAELVGHDLSISGIHNAFTAITDFGKYDMRINPNNENELFLPEGTVAGNLLMREKLPTAAGTSYPRPNQFHAHGYVNEMADAVECALDPARKPQSGALLAYDTMAVLMAAYESAEKEGVFIGLKKTASRKGMNQFLPNPADFGAVLQRFP